MRKLDFLAFFLACFFISFANFQTASAATPQPFIKVIESSGMAPFAVHVRAIYGRDDFSSDMQNCNSIYVPPYSASQPFPPQMLTVAQCLDGVYAKVDAANLATLGGLGRITTAHYQWDFGDTTSGSQYNKLEGFNAAHIYDVPGTYTITLKVTNEAGETATTTQAITVLPDQRPTYYANSTDLDALSNTLKTMYQQGQLANGLHLYFWKGATYTSAWGFNIPDGASNIVLDSTGSGSNPNLVYTGQYSFLNIGSPTGVTNTHDVVIENLSFSTPGTLAHAIMAAGTNLTIRNNVFTDLGQCVDGTWFPKGVLLLNNSAPNPNQSNGVRDYFFWILGTDLTVLGNQVKVPTIQGHGMRSSDDRTDRLLVAYNTSAITGSYGSNFQIRLGRDIYVAHNQFSNGWVVGGGSDHGFDFTNGQGQPYTKTQNFVFDSNRLILAGFYNTPEAYHFVFRNNIVSPSTASDFAAFDVRTYDPNYYYSSPVDIQVINNTYVRDPSQKHLPLVFIEQNQRPDRASPQVTIANNLYIAPDLVTMDGSSLINIESTNMSDIALVANNFWSNPQTSAWTLGGFYYMSPGVLQQPNWGNQQGWLTPSAWNQLYYAQTGRQINDVYKNITLDSNFVPQDSQAQTLGIPMPGVFEDFNGNARPTSGLTVGAVQAGSGSTSPTNLDGIISAMTNPQSGRCIGISGRSTSQGTQAILWDCDGSSDTSQSFLFTSIGSGYYTIQAQNSQQCLNIAGGNSNGGAPAIQWACGNYANEQFLAKSNSDGTFSFAVRSSGQCLALQGGGTSNGIPLVQEPCSGGPEQSFKVVSSSTSTGPTPAPNPATLNYAGLDQTTLGNWKSKYGADGYWIPNDPTSSLPSSLPSYAQLSVSGGQAYTWSYLPVDSRAPTEGNGNAGIQSCYYSGSSFTIDLNLTDGNVHRIALYYMDYDGNAGYSRFETTNIVDAASGQSLISFNGYNFYNPTGYMLFDIKGHVKITVSHVSGANAVISGIFFGGPRGTVSTPTQSAQVNYTQATAVSSNLSVSAGGGNGYGGSYNGAYLGFPNVNLGNGLQSLSVLLAVTGGYQGRYIDVYVDGPSGSGTLIGTVQTQDTGSWFNYQPQAATLNSNASKFTGVHSVFLEFRTLPNDPSWWGVANLQGFQYTFH